jgi:hypothetical protein
MIRYSDSNWDQPAILEFAFEGSRGRGYKHDVLMVGLDSVRPVASSAD